LDQQVDERPILLIDALNLFTRHFAANPTISTHGEHMGGVVGFLNALKNMVEMCRPKRVVVVWEGGGSFRRRQLFPEYKATRRPVKLNRFYEGDIPETTENRDAQVKAIVGCLQHVNVNQVYVPDCEADDVIAHLATRKFKHEHKIIMSSDRDYYQILDERTRVYRLGKKTFIDKQGVKQEFGISPNNFCLAKALCGDPSDNIPGVDGVGFKTLSKRFPRLLDDEEVELDSIIEECREHAKKSKTKLYHSIATARELIHRNIRIIDLRGTMLTPEQMRKADHVVENFVPSPNKINLIRELMQLGLTDFNADSFFYALSSVRDVQGVRIYD